jgi:hypothetical protein
MLAAMTAATTQRLHTLVEREEESGRRKNGSEMGLLKTSELLLFFI